MKIKRQPITYEHEVVVYVPCFQVNYDEEGNLTTYTSFTYSYADATDDEQMAYSCNPDYVLELRGTFKATTKDIEIGEDDESKN